MCVLSAITAKNIYKPCLEEDTDLSWHVVEPEFVAPELEFDSVSVQLILGSCPCPASSLEYQN